MGEDEAAPEGAGPEGRFGRADANPDQEEFAMTRSMQIVLFAALLLGCVGKGKYTAKELEASQARRQFQDEATRAKDLEAKVADLEGKLAASHQSLKKTETELAAVEEKSSQYEQLNKSLEGQIKSGQIELSELKGKMTVKLKDKILFSSGSAKLGKEGKVALDAVAAAFKDLKGKNVIVSGYTDDVPIGKAGGYQDNWDLSAARAAAVVRYLESKGVDPRMLGLSGYSEYRPLAPNDSAEGRSQNRRIEIALTAADYSPPEVDVAKPAAPPASPKPAETQPAPAE
jgi:chemotaxis protein MotB